MEDHHPTQPASSTDCADAADKIMVNPALRIIKTSNQRTSAPSVDKIL
jgi:hypothetical protein